MFCEHCGCSLDENAKFCISCGTRIIDESNPSVITMSATNETWSCEAHREYFWEYFFKGLIGFGIGAALAIAEGTPGALLIIGLFFAGIPYGWNLITRITRGWTLYGIVGIGLYYIFKLIFSLLISFTVYPPLLSYHLMMSQKTKSTAQIICFVIFVLSIIASILVVFRFVVLL